MFGLLPLPPCSIMKNTGAPSPPWGIPVNITVPANADGQHIGTVCALVLLDFTIFIAGKEYFQVSRTFLLPAKAASGLPTSHGLFRG